ncbi:flagellar biosynthesis protein FlgE [Pseudaeromonas sharmana]|uniref:Flagellar biosynthesis protein FlgE n=1 Tax=Pseudaeromonas sharmana TaxID=328412 RepID=A0ABV8CK85_9GAMM
MEINGAMNSGITGFQRASSQVDQSAAKLASAAATPTAAESTVNVTDELVSLKVAEQSGLASGEVIKTADEMMGTLIDIRV